MMASFRLECNNKPTRNGKYTLYLCITIGGKRKRIKTNIELTSTSQFNAKCKGDNWVRASVPESKQWNRQLHDFIEEAKEKYSDLHSQSQVSSEKLAQTLKATEVSPSFLSFAKSRTEEILAAGGVPNWKKYNSFLFKLEGYLRSKRKTDLTFSELTPELLFDFDHYLHTLRNERDSNRLLHQNTVKTIFNTFRAIVLRAIELGCMTYDKNPFLTFKCASVKTQKQKLDESELEALLALDLEKESLLWHCRNYFFFSFYCAGIRVSDLIQLRWCNITSEGRLNYQMGKNHKVRDLVIVEQAKSILQCYSRAGRKGSDYIFPLLDGSKAYAKAITQADKDTLPIGIKKSLYNDISTRTALINKYLKKLAAMAGIEKPLSMHISRHSFARMAKVEGTDNNILKSLLAHSSVATTETYMGSFDTSTTDKALQHIFNSTGNNAASSGNSDKKAKLEALLAGLDEDEVEALLQSIRKPQPPLM